MKDKSTIQLKAALLLAVFSLNTIVGFACSMGVDMSFNTSKHKEEVTKPTTHTHANGEKHEHKKEPAKASIHIHADGKKHEHHNKPAKDHPEENKSSQKEKDDCCNDKVVKIAQTDKAVAHSNTLVHPVFFTAFISCYYKIDVSYPSQVATSNKYFVRGHHPPILDVRIAIQSFQI